MWQNFSVYKWNTLKLNESDCLVPVHSQQWNSEHFFENHRGSGAVSFFLTSSLGSSSFSAAMDISAFKVWIFNTKFNCVSKSANLRPKTGPGGNIAKNYSNPILNLVTCTFKGGESFFFVKILKIDGKNLCLFNFGSVESTILNCFFCMHVLNENLFLF